MKRWFMRLATMVLAGILLLGLPAVADDPNPQQKPATVPSAADNPTGTFKTMDDLLMDVAGVIPGFGGMFWNESEQVLNVYAVGKVDETAVRNAIAATFGADTIPATKDILRPG